MKMKWNVELGNLFTNITELCNNKKFKSNQKTAYALSRLDSHRGMFINGILNGSVEVEHTEDSEEIFDYLGEQYPPKYGMDNVDPYDDCCLVELIDFVTELCDDPLLRVTPEFHILWMLLNSFLESKEVKEAEIYGSADKSRYLARILVTSMEV